MALNVAVFKTRALSALLFVVVMLAGLLWNEWSFLVLILCIHVGCWMEYQQLMQKIYPSYQTIHALHRYGVIVAGLGFVLITTGNAYAMGDFSLAQAGFWLVLLMACIAPILELTFTRQPKLLHIWISLGGLLYISLPWAAMTHLRLNSGWQPNLADKTGLIIPLTLIAAIWINDTMAYLVGSFIGKTPFSAISPKKTWEGTIGGALLCVATVTFAAKQLGTDGSVEWKHAIVISAIAAIIGTLGDLFESKLKRSAGVKDSGQILPGHGGFLDRFDSLLLALPFVWLYWFFVMKP